MKQIFLLRHSNNSTSYKVALNLSLYYRRTHPSSAEIRTHALQQHHWYSTSNDLSVTSNLDPYVGGYLKRTAKVYTSLRCWDRWKAHCDKRRMPYWLSYRTLQLDNTAMLEQEWVTSSGKYLTSQQQQHVSVVIGNSNHHKSQWMALQWCLRHKFMLPRRLRRILLLWQKLCLKMIRYRDRRRFLGQE